MRQSFTTANLEALREAQGFNDLQAREAARRKDVDELTAMEQANVPQIPKAEALRTEERKGRERRQGRGHEAGDEVEDEAQGDSEAGIQAKTAEFRLDLLA